MKNKIGIREVRALNLPKPDSHKGENGRLLIIAGSKQYHGALLYAVKAAAKFVDLIYVLSTKENQELIKKLKSKTAEFIPISDPNIRMHRNDTNYDCILIGPGMGQNKRTYNLVRRVLKSKVKAVFDADALNVLDKKLLKLLHKNVILTPHKNEFKRIFKIAPKFTIVKSEAIKQNCTIVLKGKIDIVASPGHKIKYNYTGNAGMTKGGTGDALSGLIAALYCNNSACVSAAAGIFINGLAGDELYKKVGPFYDAEDLVQQIPKTLWKILKK